jgi:cellulose synthase/poly-beta-1,6-N-acetylglucosamine synthase-like glycosyltransferase
MSTSAPRVSVVVPSWTGEVSRLQRSLAEQTFRDVEIEVVRGVSPAARARNVGAARARGDLLLFVDDDAYLGDPRVIERLVDVLDRDPDVAVVGTSKLAPPDATRFRRAVARQVPRMTYPVVDHDTDSNPPLHGYGFCAITTTCCVVRRSLFQELGGFDESLATGEDTDFFYRVHQAGGRLVVAARTWVYHDPPGDLRDLLRASFGYGLGHALEARKDPSRGMDVLRLDKRWGRRRLLFALPALPLLFLVHPYFDPERRLVLGVRPLKTLSTYAVLAGYVYGWFHGQSRRPATTYRGREPASDTEEQLEGGPLGRSA